MRVRFADVEVDGAVTDVVVDGVIAAVGADTGPVDVDIVVEGDGGALIPGLWDHHLHLLACAAALQSIVVGPPEVVDEAGVRRALADADRAAPTGQWIRAVGYHESVAGPLDRHRLDDMCRRPLRVQHRSGARWILNSAAAHAVGLADGVHAGIERTTGGEVTGVVTGADAWLRARLGDQATPDLAPVGRLLCSYGVVGVTDATPDVDDFGWQRLAAAASTGDLPQRVVVMGGPSLTVAPVPEPLRAGPVKIYLGDDRLPSLDDVAGWIATAHAASRPVAFHSVTRTTLAFAVAALDQTGAHPGDRIEHGSVIDPGLRDELVRLGVRVVTQPGLVAERGDRYLADVDVADIDHLYRCATLRSAGIPVAGSTDAPYATLDPWAAIAAAVERRTPSGVVLGPDERLAAPSALDLFLSAADDPGGPARRITALAAADLCLLDRPLADALRRPTSEHVRATMIDGRLVDAP